VELDTAPGGRSVAQLSLTVAVPRLGEPTLSTDAFFYRYRDLDGGAAHVIAGARRPTLDNLPLGQCQLVDPGTLYEDALSTTSRESALELLDAGELLTRAGGLVNRTVPRYEPRALSFVWGVDYPPEVTDARDVSSVEPRTSVYASAFGGENVGHFDVQTHLPELPLLLRVGDAITLTEPVAIDLGRDLELAWSTDGHAPEQRILVVLTWGNDGGGLYCRPTQPGRMVISERTLALLPSQPLELRVERSLQVGLRAAGLDSGTVTVSTADVVTLKSP